MNELEFELAYYNITLHHINLYTIGIPFSYTDLYDKLSKAY